ncbi:MAG: hypothetical protein IJ093_01820, partial [Bacilli bacterium]|nr:hypothetical protein [Bacilli bacterium]
SLKKTKKIGKGLTIVTCVFLILFVVVRYNNFMYTLFDNFMNNVFLQIFFPSLATFVVVFLITNGIVIYSFLSKTISGFLKVINIIFTFIIWFFTFITLDVIVQNKVNVYEPLTVYSDKTLLVLVETVMIVFVFWMIFLVSAKIIKSLIKQSDDKVVKEFLETGKDDVEVLEL